MAVTAMLFAGLFHAQEKSEDFPVFKGPCLWVDFQVIEKPRLAHGSPPLGEGTDGARPQLFIIGGFNERETYADVHSASIAEFLSGEKAAWSRGPSLPEALQGHAALAANHHIFVIGGLKGFTESRQALYSHDVLSAEMKDSRLGEWKKEKPLPQPLGYHAAVAYRGLIIVSGGQSPADVATVYKARASENGEIDGWETAGALPKPMRGHASVIVSDRLFILGGHDDGGFFANVFSTPLGEDGRMGKWEWTTPLPLPLVHFGAAERDGRIYIFGGQDAEDNLHAEIYSAEVSGSKLGNWRKEKLFPVPQSRMTVNIIDKQIIVTGGGFGWAPPVYSEIIISEIGKEGILGNWRKIGNLPRPCAFHAAIILPDRNIP